MFRFLSRRSALLLALTAGLTACAAPQTGPGGPLPQTTAGVQHGRATSWMKPEGQSQTLLYVSDTAAHVVNVYTYPGLKSAGQLTGFAFPWGLCADKTGHVWVADGGGAVYEYAHAGTSPINTLTSGMYVPTGCAINPKNGDLAVANGSVQVLVFQGGVGAPTAYRDFNFSRTMALGYDNKNNLFVDGLDQSTFFHYAELPAGGEAFTDITLNGFPPTQGAGGVQWDGTYMVVGDSEQTLYRTQGSNVIGTTALTALCPFAFYIVPSKGTVIAPDQCGTNLVGVYPYPAGGAPTKAITSGLFTPYGAVLSR